MATTAAQNINSSLPSAGQKRLLPPSPERSKRRKLETRVGDRQADHLNVAITGTVRASRFNAGDSSPSIDLPTTKLGSTNATRPPIPELALDRPPGMSRSEFIKQLHTKIVAERDASACDE